VIKLRRMSWAEYVAGVWEKRGAYRVLVGGYLRERHNLEDLGINELIILLRIFKKWLQGLDSISLAEDRDRLWVFVNTVMNFRFAYNAENFCLAVELLAAQEGSCSTALVNCPVLRTDVISSLA
jgi:hypothetical protein